MQQRLFEDLIESDVVQHKTKQSYTLPVSIAIHGAVSSERLRAEGCCARKGPDYRSAPKAKSR